MYNFPTFYISVTKIFIKFERYPKNEFPNLEIGARFLNFFLKI